MLTAALERILFYPEPFFHWLFRRQSKSVRPSLTSGPSDLASERDSTSAKGEKGLGANADVPALDISHLVKRYGKNALAVDDLSFSVRRGGLTCLLGSNGSGKSTTIGVISGTTGATSGRVAIEGYERNAAPPGVLGLCPQKWVF